MNNRGKKNISCKEAIERVFDFIDNHLEEKSQEELENHVETCRHCFDRIEFEKMLRKKLQKVRIEKISEEFRNKVEGLIDRF